ncbi:MULTISPECIES: hypothetical protein [unclassified Butyrivibrio]|uniref:hypothetical protein n=1 Tax=unclassified Butyrivibrio TaxID=2639466 RepID=UPI000411ED1C|nr:MULTISPECIES: hypothetical protein [unclassified Butyrivibrio]
MEVRTNTREIGEREAFNYLRKRWSKIDDPVKIITDLQKYQDMGILQKKYLAIRDINHFMR